MTLYEFGRTISQEPSAALTSGLDEHAIRRQASFLAYAKGMAAAMAKRPIPDLPGTHPLTLTIDLSVPYQEFGIGPAGTQVPLNEQTALLADYWLVAAAELAKSNSAGLAGSLTEFDYNRCDGILNVITKLLDEMTTRPMLDLPETGAPQATLMSSMVAKP